MGLLTLKNTGAGNGAHEPGAQAPKKGIKKPPERGENMTKQERMKQERMKRERAVMLIALRNPERRAQIMALLRDAERETREAAVRIEHPAARAGAE